eukprot:scaffold81948_cov16-Prasinocladus_malaysianus.AAC.1
MAHKDARKVIARDVQNGELAEFRSVYAATKFVTSKGFLTSSMDNNRNELKKWLESGSVMHGFQWAYGEVLRSTTQPKLCSMRSVETGVVHSFRSYYGVAKKLIELKLIQGLPKDKYSYVARLIRNRATEHGFSYFPCETPDDSPVAEETNPPEEPSETRVGSEESTVNEEDSVNSSHALGASNDNGTSDEVGLSTLGPVIPTSSSVETTTTATSLDDSNNSGSTLRSGEEDNTNNRREVIGSPQWYTFSDQVNDMFVGKRLRVFVTDEKRVVSAFDVISVILGEGRNLCVEFRKILNNYPDFQYERHIFGPGHRPTPVIDAAGFVRLAMLLPGAKAAKFRDRACDVLRRYLEGDVTLVSEIVQNSQNASTSPTSELFAPPQDHVNRLFRLGNLTAPRLEGKTLSDFTGTCVYVLKIRHEGRDLIKIGRTDEFILRLDAHDRHFQVESVYSVVPCQQFTTVEKKVKDRLRPFRYPILINGRRSMEVYFGISAEQVDRVVVECTEQTELLDEREYNLRMAEIDARKEEAIASARREEAIA